MRSPRSTVTALTLGWGLAAGAVAAEGPAREGTKPTVPVDSARRAMPDARLQRSDGQPVQLSRWRGRPVVLIYEDRHSVQLNQPLKEALFERGRASGALDAVALVAVANLESFNFFPARGIALSFVRDAEKKAGVPIFVDLQGALGEAPWGLPDRTSSVLLLDRQGAEVFRASGALSAADTERFFAVLGALVGRDLGEQAEAVHTAPPPAARPAPEERAPADRSGTRRSMEDWP
ncbi:MULTISPECIES: hypothetical protein [Myxococcaceae]|uniref:TlpA family protein disulfide reductase n=1 Tax=Myxococcaceae TaxID=31 RepID=UPI00188FFF1F|nr:MULTISPECIES: hypothetical protein [Myxococcaceae]MBF5042991.1 hypothetical protein [Simulacricoccus sp. 17bor-14]